MNPVKRFFLVLFGVYIVAWIVLMILLGPAGLSRDYLDADNNKADHDRYVEIRKTKPYKLHMQNPEAHPATGSFAADVTFVKEYESRPAFQEESHRTHLFYLIFEIINAAAIVIIAVRFGRKPLLNFLDQKLEEVRDKIERARKAREEASTRRKDAEDRLAHMEADKKSMAERAAELSAQECAQIHQATEQALEQIDKETEDRKHLEEHHAAMLVKRELVEQAVDAFAKQYQASATGESESMLIDQFMQGMEGANGQSAKGAPPV